MDKEYASYHHHFGIELYEGRLHAHRFPPHYHFNYTVVLVDEGEMIYSFAGDVVHVAPGEALIINPLDAHYNMPGVGGCVYKAIFLPVGIFSNDDDSMLFFPRERIAVEAQVTALQSCFRQIQQLNSEASKERLLAGLLGLLMEHFSPIPGRTAYDHRILPALEYINTHPDEKLPISHLARLCFMSPFHFQRVFKGSVGLTLKAYIQQQKTELGRRRLMEGRSAAEAVYEAGYFDQAHFHKAFKKCGSSILRIFPEKAHDFTKSSVCLCSI